MRLCNRCGTVATAPLRFVSPSRILDYCSAKCFDAEAVDTFRESGELRQRLASLPYFARGALANGLLTDQEEFWLYEDGVLLSPQRTVSRLDVPYPENGGGTELVWRES